MMRWLVIVAVLGSMSLAGLACEQRVVRRRGIGDPLHREGPAESPKNYVKQKYDGGEFERPD